VRRLVRVTARLMIVTAMVGAAIRVGRAILGRPSGVSGDGAIRTGSFDSWPTVPVAPGRR